MDRHYPGHLPSTSVVIIFHNEAYTVLLRTITSILNRSPPNLLHEIILVDDCSNHGKPNVLTCTHVYLYVCTYMCAYLTEDLQEKLENWIATNPLIKLLRHKKREGLIRARMTGAGSVTGEVMVFLDSHCECNVGWLEPLLARVEQNRSTVACPVIDVISWEKIEYSTVRGPPGVRGGFNWGLQFKWKKIPQYEQERRNFDETRYACRYVCCDVEFPPSCDMCPLQGNQFPHNGWGAVCYQYQVFL